MRETNHDGPHPLMLHAHANLTCLLFLLYSKQDRLCTVLMCWPACTLSSSTLLYSFIRQTVSLTISRYLVSLSGALALLNMVPCYSLDGQWALFALVDHTLTSFIPDEDQRNMLCNVILTLGTLLLAANIMLALWTLGST